MTERRGRLRAVPGALAVLASVLAVLAYGWLWRSAPIIDGDSPQYMVVAQDLADGRIDALHDRTPGYPLLLALTGSAFDVSGTLLYAGLVLHVVSVWILCWAFLASGGPPRLAVLMGVLLMLPLYVEPAGYVMTENLAQATLVVVFAALMRWRLGGSLLWVVLAGLACAAATLVRPAYQLLPAALACCLLPDGWRRGTCWRDRIGAPVVLVLGAVLSLLPYVWFNARQFGFTGVTFSTGFHLTTKTMAFIERLPDEYADIREVLIRERDAQLTKRGGTHTGTQTIWSVREELQAITGRSRPEVASLMLRLNLKLIAQAPLEYLQEVARSFAVYWFPAVTPLAAMGSRILRSTWILLHTAVVGFWWVQLLVVAGLFLYRRWIFSSRESAVPFVATGPQASAFWFAAVIVFYTMLVTCIVDIGEPRQRRPTDVFVVFASVVGIDVWRRTRQRVTTGAGIPAPAAPLAHRPQDTP
jgi:hypothetical protein